MPNFNFSDAQLDDMVEFLKWTNGVDTGEVAAQHRRLTGLRT